MQKRIEAKSILEIKIVILRTIVRSIAWLAKFYQHSNLKRLRNKCAMTDYSHAELVSVSCGLNPSQAFQAHSAQGRQGHTHRTALRFPLSPQVARENILDYMRKTPYNSMKYEPTLLKRATWVAQKKAMYIRSA